MKVKSIVDDTVDLDELFGRPPLLTGESRARYDRLREEVSRSMNPRNFFDEMAVQEVTDSIWETQRYKKLSTKLIDAERLNAFHALMESSRGYVSEKAEKWFEELTDDPKNKATIADVCKKVGLSTALVHANSVLSAGDKFFVLDRLAANRNAAGKAALKEYERRKRVAAKDKRLAAKQKQLTNDNDPSKRNAQPRAKHA